MPTYDYKCDACGHAFEKFQSITAAPIRKCPKCGKSKVKRLIGTGAGLIFKGSGFYITDYRDSGYKESAKADSTAPSDAKSSDGKAGGESKADSSAKKDVAKSDTKAQTKSESKPEPKSSRSPKKQ